MWFVLSVLVSIIDNLIIVNGILHYCMCCFLNVVIYHLTLRILSLVANFGTVIHMSFALSQQYITYSIDIIRMHSNQVLGLLHHKMRFGNLGIKFLQQCIYPTSVTHTNQLIDNIRQVFFQHWKQHVNVDTSCCL
jgi:hypothetical protein